MYKIEWNSGIREFEVTEDYSTLILYSNEYLEECEKWLRDNKNLDIINAKLCVNGTDIFKYKGDKIMTETNKLRTFEAELTTLINKYSIENGLNTPDFILASYLRRCLENYELITKQREEWYGVNLHIGMVKPNFYGE